MEKINNAGGLRKGTWTKEEDILLRQCVEKHGEGKWHQVPQRAGLNRCRKSCRLRWLNYLRPNIKRSRFSKDEVDLVVRLHKLLGNKWTLIAGRLPERTANDVKNFWNTYVAKNPSVAIEDQHKRIARKTKVVTQSNIIKPRPRTLSIKLHETLATEERKSTKLNESRDDIQNPVSYEDTLISPQEQLVNENIQWWNKLLESTMEKGQSVNPCLEVRQTGETTSPSELRDGDDDNYNATNGDIRVFAIEDLHVWNIADQ